MINWEIKIQDPVLTTGMSFQVRYRKVDSDTWAALSPNPTSNNFTIKGLEDGDYEAEIKTVCANGEISEAVFHSTLINAMLTWKDGTQYELSTPNASVIVVLSYNIPDTSVTISSKKLFIQNESGISNQTIDIEKEISIIGGKNIIYAELTTNTGRTIKTNSLVCNVPHWGENTGEIVITWEDGTTTNKDGFNTDVVILNNAANYSELYWQWQSMNHDLIEVIPQGNIFTSDVGENAYILRVKMNDGRLISSNVLYYTRKSDSTIPPNPNVTEYSATNNREGSSGNVTFINKNGLQETITVDFPERRSAGDPAPQPVTAYFCAYEVISQDDYIYVTTTGNPCSTQ